MVFILDLFVKQLGSIYSEFKRYYALKFNLGLREQEKKTMLDQIELRAATVEDAAEVAEVYLASRKKFLPYAPIVHPDDGVRNWIKNFLIPKANVEVALLNGEILGMCATTLEKGISWIDQLYLRPDSVGSGIGTLMLERALAKLDRPIRLYTFQENEGGRRFYERFGFKAIEFGDGSGNEEGAPDVLYELI